MFENHFYLQAKAALLLGIIPLAAAYESEFTTPSKKTTVTQIIVYSIMAVLCLVVPIYLIYRCYRKPKTTTMYVYEEEEPVPMNNSDNINNGNGNMIVNVNFNGDTSTNGGVINKGAINGDVFSGGTNITSNNSGNNNANTTVIIPQTTIGNTSAVYGQPAVQYVQYPQAVAQPMGTPYYSYYPQPGVSQGVPVVPYQ